MTGLQVVSTTNHSYLTQTVHTSYSPEPCLYPDVPVTSEPSPVGLSLLILLLLTSYWRWWLRSGIETGVGTRARRAAAPSTEIERGHDCECHWLSAWSFLWRSLATSTCMTHFVWRTGHHIAVSEGEVWRTLRRGWRHTPPVSLCPLLVRGQVQGQARLSTTG